MPVMCGRVAADCGEAARESAATTHASQRFFMTANILVEEGGGRLTHVRFSLAASPGSGWAVSWSKVVASSATNFRMARGRSRRGFRHPPGARSDLGRSRDCVADSLRRNAKTADRLGGSGKGIQELSEKPSRLLRLFESCVVPGPGDDAHLAAGNVLSHEFGLVRSGENVFLAGDQQGGHVDGL